MSREFGLLLRVLRLRAGLDQQPLAMQLGLSQPTVSRWETGFSRPSVEQLEQFLAACAAASIVPACALPIDVCRSIHRDIEAGNYERAAQVLREVLRGLVERPRSDVNHVPYFAHIAAGLGEEQAPLYRARGSVEVPAEILQRDPRAYALRVRGDSMNPQLADGDIVIISPAAGLSEGCIVAAQVGDEGDVVKRYHALPDGRIELQALNPAYAPLLLAAGPESLAALRDAGHPPPPDSLELPGLEGRIWGRVVLLLREL